MGRSFVSRTCQRILLPPYKKEIGSCTRIIVSCSEVKIFESLLGSAILLPQSLGGLGATAEAPGTA